jgi:murein DD-endopeptidase MepM/ murein hydrolase activator NlpD
MKKIILLIFFIISCSNKPALVLNDTSVLVNDDTAIPATIYNISVDSIKASITFDIRSDFDKYLLDVQNPINKTFLIKRFFPSLHDSSVSMYEDEIDFLGLNSRRFVSMNRNGNEINMKFSIDTLQLKNHIETEIRKLKDSLPIHYLFDKGGKVPDFSKITNQIILPIDGLSFPKRASRLPNAPRSYRSGTHRGIDFFSNWGTPVRSVADGIIIRSDINYKEMPADFRIEMLKRASLINRTPSDIFNELLLGQAVIIDHGLDLFPEYRAISIYAHLSSIIPKFEVGYNIKSGETFGYSGNTGTSPSTLGTKKESHLHWELILQDSKGEYYFGQDLEYSELIEALDSLFIK